MRHKDHARIIDMARPARFERTTPAFGGQYSIQLSYGRESAKHSGFVARRLSTACGFPYNAGFYTPQPI